MSNNKQTAVEWLIEQLKSRYGIYIERLTVTDQAKEIEKKQIIDAHIHGHNAPSSTVKMYDGEQYYNEEYGGNNEQQ